MLLASTFHRWLSTEPRIFTQSGHAEAQQAAYTNVRNQAGLTVDASNVGLGKYFCHMLMLKMVKKVLLGDNLASHFTPEVIQAAVDNNIEFVCLIPNSTHILQPLDVAVFRSVKVEWRRIMEA